MEDIDFDYEFEDVICQRSKAMCILAQCHELSADPEVKHQLMTMLRKVNISVNLPATAELHVLDTGPKMEQKSESLTGET